MKLIDKKLGHLSRLPYAPLGEDPSTGVDCAWVVREVFLSLGLPLPPYVNLRDLGEFISGRWVSVRGQMHEPLDVMLSRSDTGAWGHLDVAVDSKYAMTCVDPAGSGFRFISQIENVVGHFRWVGGAA